MLKVYWTSVSFRKAEQKVKFFCKSNAKLRNRLWANDAASNQFTMAALGGIRRAKNFECRKRPWCDASQKKIIKSALHATDFQLNVAGFSNVCIFGGISLATASIILYKFYSGCLFTERSFKVHNTIFNQVELPWNSFLALKFFYCPT